MVIWITKYHEWCSAVMVLCSYLIPGHAYVVIFPKWKLATERLGQGDESGEPQSLLYSGLELWCHVDRLTVETT